MGPSNCFCQDDLYTTKFGNWESREIEQKFFGRIDTSGREAIEYFTNFQHPSADPIALKNMLIYMSTQKLRTPKGLAYLSDIKRIDDKNLVLMELQRLRDLHSALWMECIWSIADASAAETKFIVSDNPVTVYNKSCYPLSEWCRGAKDPEIWYTGTLTLLPLSPDKVLILTNLSWVRNPYESPLMKRPHSVLFRPAVFNFTQIQTGRTLSDLEVNEINYILKKRAYRYISSAEEEWLYPEKKIKTKHWNKLGNGYLLMPDPRSVSFSSEIVFGYDNKKADWYDAYGRKPWHGDYDNKMQSKKEWITFNAFKGEFARIFGPQRRGISFQWGSLEEAEDSPELHSYHLKCEKEYKAKLKRLK